MGRSCTSVDGEADGDELSQGTESTIRVEMVCISDDSTISSNGDDDGDGGRIVPVVIEASTSGRQPPKRVRFCQEEDLDSAHAATAATALAEVPSWRSMAKSQRKRLWYNRNEIKAIHTDAVALAKQIRAGERPLERGLEIQAGKTILSASYSRKARIAAVQAVIAAYQQEFQSEDDTRPDHGATTYTNNNNNNRRDICCDDETVFYNSTMAQLCQEVTKPCRAYAAILGLHDQKIAKDIYFQSDGSDDEPLGIGSGERHSHVNTKTGSPGTSTTGEGDDNSNANDDDGANVDEGDGDARWRPHRQNEQQQEHQQQDDQAKAGFPPAHDSTGRTNANTNALQHQRRKCNEDDDRKNGIHRNHEHGEHTSLSKQSQRLLLTPSSSTIPLHLRRFSLTHSIPDSGNNGNDAKTTPTSSSSSSSPFKKPQPGHSFDQYMHDSELRATILEMLQ